jgi:ubiquinone/menaquinone biosynthesis C-methylase UbiE
MGHVCHWRHAYLFDNALRRLFQKPERLVAPYLGQGMTALDVGCGMGFFSIAMARLVGERGRVIAVDLQPQMLDVLMKRAGRKGVAGRITPHQCGQDSIGVTERVDFAVAMWVVHEVPDQVRLLEEIAACLKPGAKFLVAEPKLHVSRAAFEKLLEEARAVGLVELDRPKVGLSRAAVLEARSS